MQSHIPHANGDVRWPFSENACITHLHGGRRDCVSQKFYSRTHFQKPTQDTLSMKKKHTKCNNGLRYDNPSSSYISTFQSRPPFSKGLCIQKCKIWWYGFVPGAPSPSMRLCGQSTPPFTSASIHGKTRQGEQQQRATWHRLGHFYSVIVFLLLIT